MEPDKVKVITTDDGSHSLFVPQLNETYHSFHGALQESEHVFIKEGLHFIREEKNLNPISIFEVGFGTGLNALLTFKEALQLQQHIHYTTIEPYPLSDDVVAQLNYEKLIPSDAINGALNSMHVADWDDDAVISEYFTFRKINTKLEQIDLPETSFDLIYFDAFAPSKQPELWGLELLEKVVSLMKDNAVFVTYCAKGQLKRDLVSLGLEVETLPGPPGKKEMVRAVKIK